jgi:hypothetical protein
MNPFKNIFKKKKRIHHKPNAPLPIKRSSLIIVRWILGNLFKSILVGV